MPPFRLELPDKKIDRRTKTTLYSRKTYGPGVKVTNWEQYSESLPTDVDPYCPTAFNLHYSHYNRLGVEKEVNYTSTAKDMMQQLFNEELTWNKSTGDEPFTMCSSPSSEAYRTSMQHHYQPPYPMKMQRVSEFIQTGYWLS
ncbi:hypothetical protein NQ318_001409 [Aromia moschata]|uniref:Uncharacterized protein n=1 Tax=Aromia moschata TaxID=1265417 RepID=A0AAV8YVU1_9CUCU|nr:hypothetical protein NQ318_001409 [Aromia moschata]